MYGRLANRQHGQGERLDLACRDVQAPTTGRYQPVLQRLNLDLMPAGRQEERILLRRHRPTIYVHMRLWRQVEQTHLPLLCGRNRRSRECHCRKGTHQKHAIS